jgi:hypothetical protein
MMKHLATAALLLALSILALPLASDAVTRTVPGTHASIQAAIGASAYGDVVSIGPGTFSENLNLKNGVTLQGAGIDVTFIDGKATNTAIYVAGGASAATKILDLTVKNGKATNGAGVYIADNNHCELQRVKVAGNVATNKGGGVYVGLNSTPLVDHCEIHGNKAKYGGGVYLQTSQGTIQYTVICHNEATTNGGGIFAAYDGSGIIWCTVESNSSPGGAGATFSQSFVAMHTTIFSNNVGGYGVWTNRAFAEACNVYWANSLGAMSGQAPAADDLFLDPMYCNIAGHDFSLNFSSPCVLGPCEKQIGALGPVCGAPPPTATEATSWGNVKGLFAR